MLEVCNLSFRYDDHSEIFSNLSFQVPKHAFVAIVGLSGIGKSTLLKCCAGLLPSLQGEVSYAGEMLASQARLGRLIYMPQQDALLPWKTVGENVALSLELKGVSKRLAMQQARVSLRDFHMEHLFEHQIWQLSGGMRQRIAFLRTMLTDADVLLLDEPFSALDGFTRQQIQTWLIDLMNKVPRTVLMITHDIEEAILLADTIFVWKDSPCQNFHVVQVPLTKPRNRSAVFAESFISIKKHILELLELPTQVAIDRVEDIL